MAQEHDATDEEIELFSEQEAPEEYLTYLEMERQIRNER